MFYYNIIPSELYIIILLKLNIENLLSHRVFFKINWIDFFILKLKHDFKTIDFKNIPSYLYSNINDTNLIIFNYYIVKYSHDKTIYNISKILNNKYQYKDIYNESTPHKYSLSNINNIKLLNIEDNKLNIDLLKDRIYNDNHNNPYNYYNDNYKYLHIYNNVNNVNNNKSNNVNNFYIKLYINNNIIINNINFKNLYNILFHFYLNGGYEPFI